MEFDVLLVSYRMEAKRMIKIMRNILCIWELLNRLGEACSGIHPGYGLNILIFFLVVQLHIEQVEHSITGVAIDGECLCIGITGLKFINT